ncbi:MAG: hypothetical protein IPM42_13445 [Saprospiraceae bacterium]|nr:hypothetical protein [Saprospiraceae bacterium]
MNNYLIIFVMLFQMQGCHRSTVPFNNISDCMLISEILKSIKIIDELPCAKKINIVVDTINVSYLHTWDFGKPKAIKAWNFYDCNNFDIGGNKNVIIIPVKYEMMHSNITDMRMQPPKEDECFSLIISNLYEYENHFLIHIVVENHTNSSYSGAFMFKMDKFSTSEIRIINYSPNQNSLSGKNLKNIFPLYNLKPRF